MPDPATPEPPRPGAVSPGVLDAVAVRRVWPEVVGKVNRSNKRIAALMRDAVVRDLDGDTLVLTVKSAVLARMMSDHAQVLTDALYEELGGRWQIRCEVAGERSGVSPGSARGVPTAGPALPPGVAGHGAPTPGADRGRSGGTSDTERPAATSDTDRPGDAAATVSDDDEWPEPARPGGSASASSVVNGTSDDEWPEPARPGGSSAEAGADPSSAPRTAASHTSADGPTAPGVPAGRGASPQHGSSAAAPNPTASTPGWPDEQLLRWGGHYFGWGGCCAGWGDGQRLGWGDERRLGWGSGERRAPADGGDERQRQIRSPRRRTGEQCDRGGSGGGGRPGSAYRSGGPADRGRGVRR
ncbi:hypothetical protein GCM10029963_50720 [Micromonospora andamanensis]